MLNRYVATIATQMGMSVSKVSVREVRSLGCLDTSILTLESNGNVASEYVRKSELDCLQNNTYNESLELKIKVALVRLNRHLVQ